MKQRLFLLSLLFLSLTGFGQSSTTLKGIGSIGGTTDKITLRKYNGSLTSAYLYRAYFAKVSDKKAGVGIAIRNDSVNSTNGKIAVTHVLFRNDSLLVYSRDSLNKPLVKLFGKKNIPLPQYAGIEVNNNKLKVYTSKYADYRNPTKHYESNTIFTKYRYKTPNLIFPISKTVASVDIKGIAIKSITADTSGGGVTPPEPTILASISNVAKTIPIQTTINFVPLNSIGEFTAPTYTNAQGYIRPKWGVWWNFFGKYFVDANKDAWQFGLMGNTAITPNFYYGNGLRGQEFIWPLNYDSGLPWPDDIDPYVGQSFWTFTSSIPYQHRFFEEGLHGGQRLDSLGLEGSYDFGRGVAKDPVMGFGDNVGSKSHRGLIAVDIEDGTADFGSQYHRAALIGMAENTTGDVSSDYGAPINTIGYIHSPETGAKILDYYPDSLGNYPSGANISTDWLSTTPTLSIPSRGVSNKRPVDYPNIIPSSEVSFWSYEWAKQDSVYNLGGGNTIIINKYGSGRNSPHFLARAGTLLEWNAWYCRYKLSGRRFKMLTKVIADKGNIGLNEYVPLASGGYAPDVLNEHKGALAGRKNAFHLVSLTYMNSVDLHEWDKNSYDGNKSHDTYVGFFAAMKMLMTNGGAADYLDFVPQYWNTEQSYNHTTWVKHKAIDWADSSSILPCRTKVKSNKLEAMCWRPEGIEPTEVWLRANVGGTMREIHIEPSSWETLNPLYQNTAKNLLPNKEKDYFYIIKSY